MLAIKQASKQFSKSASNKASNSARMLAIKQASNQLSKNASNKGSKQQLSKPANKLARERVIESEIEKKFSSYFTFNLQNLIYVEET